MTSKPILLMVPCFAGAPWKLDQLARLQGWRTRTMRLPDGLDDTAGIQMGGIRRSRELIVPRTGHMFRFSHSGRHSEAVSTCLTSAIPTVGDAR